MSLENCRFRRTAKFGNFRHYLVVNDAIKALVGSVIA